VLGCHTVTQPPEDHTQHFDPFGEGSYGDSSGDDRTRAIPPVGEPAGETAYFPFPATEPTAPRGSASVRAHAVYRDAAATGAVASPTDPAAQRRKRILLVSGAVAAVVLVLLVGWGVGKALGGGGSTAAPSTNALPVVSDSPSPEESPSDAPSESPSPSASPSPSPSPSRRPSPSPSPKPSPSPQALGPRLLAFDAPAKVDCSVPTGQTVTLSWRAADADTIQITVDGGKSFSTYAVGDSPAKLQYPCDGKDHSYTARAVNNGKQASAPITRTVRPKGIVPSSSPSP
jgi:hypothetical protein